MKIPGVFDLIKLSNDALPAVITSAAGFAPIMTYAEVPAEVKAKMEEINTALLDGSLQTNVPPAKP
jgi:hypothetical protein